MSRHSHRTPRLLRLACGPALLLALASPALAQGSDTGRSKRPSTVRPRERSKQPRRREPAELRKARRTALDIFVLLRTFNFDRAAWLIAEAEREGKAELVQQAFFDLTPSPAGIERILRRLERDRPAARARLRRWLTGQARPLPAPNPDQPPPPRPPGLPPGARLY